MRPTITQFMWGYQPHFRLEVERAAEAALDSVGAPLEPRVLLIGFNTRGNGALEICVEPETGPLQPHHLAAVTARGTELYDQDPDSKMFYSDRRIQQQRRDDLRRSARARALVEAISNSAIFPGKFFFASASTVIDGYSVHTCIGVDRSKLDLLFALKGERHERFYVPRSLVHEIIHQLLRNADLALHFPLPGHGQTLPRSPSEIVRAAAQRLVTGCIMRAGEFCPGEMFETLNRVSAQRYEKADAGGQVIITQPRHPALRQRLRFTEPLQLRRVRAIRKLLQMSSSTRLSLLTDGQKVYGLGELDTTSALVDQDLFEITISAHATWQLTYNGKSLMLVEYGTPTLPRPLIDLAVLTDTFLRRFPHLGDPELGQFCTLVRSLANTDHGTTLVISSEAEAEAARLRGQATLVEPILLSEDLIHSVSQIDGAILLDPSGMCFAIGVILDGQAASEGDRARGARYNSAVWYLRTTQIPTVVVVVSSDGSIDILPQLRPKIQRQEVATAIHELRSAAKGEFDPEAFYRAWRRLKQLSFYLDAAQCNEANELRDQLEDRRWEEIQMRVEVDPLAPSPEMNSSYFLDP